MFPGAKHNFYDRNLQQIRFNPHASENNYWQFREFDFEDSDMPTILPHDSFGKYYFPQYYTKPGHDWECAAP